MAYTLQELTTARTRHQIERAIYESLAAKGVNTTGWRPDAVVRTIITGVAIVLAAFERLQVAIARGGFLETAEGDWLTVLARKQFGVERIEGTHATGTVIFTNHGGGFFDFEPGDVVVKNTPTGATYRNAKPFTLRPGQSVPVDVVATERGSIGNARAGEIDDLETKLLGVSVTNPAGLLGIDRETDAQLRERCHARAALLSPMGPFDAYLYAARSARRPDGTSAGITRVRTIADGFGGVRVIVADADGDADAEAVDAVHAELYRSVVPDGIRATVEAAQRRIVDASYRLWVRDELELSNGEIEETVNAAVGEMLSHVPIGGDRIPGEPVGRVYRSAIAGAIADALGAQHVVRAELVTPAADLTIAANEAPAPGAITPVAIHRVES